MHNVFTRGTNYSKQTCPNIDHNVQPPTIWDF